MSQRAYPIYPLALQPAPFGPINDDCYQWSKQAMALAGEHSSIRVNWSTWLKDDPERWLQAAVRLMEVQEEATALRPWVIGLPALLLEEIVKSSKPPAASPMV